jgi:ABC-type transporter MlaC component
MTRSVFPARFLAVSIMLLVLGLTAPFARAASCPAAGAVERAAQALMDAARRSTAGAFSSALARHVDVRGTAMFALGQYRSGLPPARQREYVAGTHAYMARFLLNRARPFRSSRDLKIESCKGNLVQTSLEGRSKMVWRVSGGRIRDVQVSGVWLAIQLRSKFTGIIRRNNGKVEALLAFLRGSGD